MALQPVNIPEQLLQKLKEVAAREEITVEELVRDALEQRINGNGFSQLFAIGDRNVNRTGAKPEDVETEIQAHRSERRR
ncbi:MAG: ribbon-helix-helix protein, CopG family [Acidobacteriaceae bacterium]|nr:ribbon-helix-helix protein, CopG family [Acidobacteriaceae bacterium]MBV9767046.1 ribbon-helix-helix protein, CopG family [Acidobacteriaceae bacterium]